MSAGVLLAFVGFALTLRNWAALRQAQGPEALEGQEPFRQAIRPRAHGREAQGQTHSKGTSRSGISRRDSSGQIIADLALISLVPPL
jgi:hypothetical protein